VLLQVSRHVLLVFLQGQLLPEPLVPLVSLLVSLLSVPVFRSAEPVLALLVPVLLQVAESQA
jgi:hypothetical protein